MSVIESWILSSLLRLYELGAGGKGKVSLKFGNLDKLFSFHKCHFTPDWKACFLRGRYFSPSNLRAWKTVFASSPHMKWNIFQIHFSNSTRLIRRCAHGSLLARGRSSARTTYFPVWNLLYLKEKKRKDMGHMSKKDAWTFPKIPFLPLTLRPRDVTSLSSSRGRGVRGCPAKVFFVLDFVFFIESI